VAIKKHVGGSKSGGVIGIPEMKALLDKVGDDFDRAVRSALFIIGTEIGNESQDLVPVDTGNLRASMDVTRPKKAGVKQARVEITYGGTTGGKPINYAIIQHERLDYNHPKGGQAKYLEQPFLQRTAEWPKPIVDTIKREGLL